MRRNCDNKRKISRVSKSKSCYDQSFLHISNKSVSYLFFLEEKLEIVTEARNCVHNSVSTARFTYKGNKSSYKCNFTVTNVITVLYMCCGDPI